MDYRVFERLEEGQDFRTDRETGQDFMARILQGVINGSDNDNPQILNDLVAPEFVDCDFNEQSLHVRYPVKDWELNPNGTLHGGIISTVCDITMGVLARFMFCRRQAVTVELNTNYMNPARAGSQVLVCAKVKKNGKRVKFLECKVYSEDDGKILADASGIFM